ncbi:MAG TPA: 4Fe-4S binding protein [Spirochaetota bacterium]|nr:4Fe-4S binding protein [Spirochaetota bacterium]HPL17425.1 4Fe-4S binding protein [Spirochaetota bacterium]HQF08001.1 4Fe-4S binding protein [Spirochaetota bacterium]HQH96561.1 4Fe-4S binding protein [Spirochaetota bacterium]HQJ69733.1 4Fe-4S binding protein [Spirochaetota bacterium]
MKASTKIMMKKHGWRYDRFIHNYIYFKFYHPYVKFVYYLFKFLSQYLFWFKPINGVLSMALARYHSKVLSYGDTKKIFTLNENISAISAENKKIVPFKYAYKILFMEPEHIAVMDCPCKVALGDRDENILSCLAVGKGLSSFWLEHGKKYNARQISQKDALALIEKFRKMGYLTQAFFKVATGGSTGVICNCHPDTCVSLQATKFAKKFDRKFTMNAAAGYSVEFAEKKCKWHGTCQEVCPVGAIKVDKTSKNWTYDKDACIGCELCVEHCPEKALSFYRDNAKPVPLDIEIVKKEFVTPN